MLVREAPIAIRNAISRRRPLKRTSRRLATLLQAINKTKLTAANSVTKPARKFRVTSSGNVRALSSRAVDVVRILGTITLLQRWQCSACLLNGHPRFQSSDYAQKKGAAHHLLITEAGNLKRFRRPNFRDRVRPNHVAGISGRTPMIVCGVPSSVMLRPITFGSPPRRSCQKFFVTNATSALSSSSGRKLRPKLGEHLAHRNSWRSIGRQKFGQDRQVRSA